MHNQTHACLALLHRCIVLHHQVPIGLTSLHISIILHFQVSVVLALYMFAFYCTISCFCTSTCTLMNFTAPSVTYCIDPGLGFESRSCLRIFIYWRIIPQYVLSVSVHILSCAIFGGGPCILLITDQDRHLNSVLHCRDWK